MTYLDRVIVIHKPLTNAFSPPLQPITVYPMLMLKYIWFKSAVFCDGPALCCTMGLCFDAAEATIRSK